MANLAKVIVYEEKAVAEFEKATSPELKEMIKEIDWLKWSKKTVDGKTYWKLNIVLSEDPTRLEQFVNMLRSNQADCMIKKYGESVFMPWDMWRRHQNQAPESQVRPYNVYLRPAYFEELTAFAKEKHMSFSQLVICAMDSYIRAEKAAEPLQTRTAPVQMVVDSFSEKMRIEMVRQQTKPAWVADKLNIPRSRFYTKLDTNNWTEDEKEKISRFFGWS